MGFVKRRESFRFGLLSGSDWHCSIVGFKGEGFGHALVDLVSGPEDGSTGATSWSGLML